MAVFIEGQTYYRTAEVCRMTGISRNSLFRWLKGGMVGDVEYRDWRGWRLFTSAQLEALGNRSKRLIAIASRG